jgi:uncharacterized protein (DUF2236 family)
VEAFWQEWVGVGRLVGVRERDLPRTWVDFEPYFARVVAEDLEWTPAVPELLATLGGAPPPDLPGLRPALWRGLRVPMARHLLVTTAGLLPPDLRERLRIPYSRSDAALFRALAAASRLSGPVVRGPLREFGPYYLRWRRAALERGDVASAPPGHPQLAA